MNNLVLLLVAVLVAMPPRTVRGECWDTGCQSDTWLVQGCKQYGMVERKRRPCTGGQVYTCCSDGGGGHGPGSAILTKSGDITYYNLGLTACGRVYADNDMVAAVAFGYFTFSNPNYDPMCGRQAVIRDPTTSKSIVVTIVDKCEGCKIDDIDVSPSAFEMLKPKTVGRFKVTWDFI